MLKYKTVPNLRIEQMICELSRYCPKKIKYVLFNFRINSNKKSNKNLDMPSSMKREFSLLQWEFGIKSKIGLDNSKHGGKYVKC